MKLLDVTYRHILGPVSTEFRSTALTCIVGANGAGKTTLLRTMAGILPPSAGKIEHAHGLQYLPAAMDIPFAYPIEDVVSFGLFPWHRGWPTSDDRAAVDRAIKLFGLGGLTGRAITDLSHGERTRVHLARGWVGAERSPIALFDEPTAHLDIYWAHSFLKACRKFVQQGKTIVVTIHDLQLAAQFADDILVLKHGRIVKHAAADRALEDEVIYDVFGVKRAQEPGLAFRIEGM